ncbi:MAG TPA: hypothetical protein VHY82_16030 [Acetobacteraceae bacterium]|jgi:hypothetical protein|nr:hypothetical protein [Acetobacteraceae bacterium]
MTDDAAIYNPEMALTLWHAVLDAREAYNKRIDQHAPLPEISAASSRVSTAWDEYETYMSATHGPLWARTAVNDLVEAERLRATRSSTQEISE